jgi:hypothetical protein
MGSVLVVVGDMLADQAEQMPLPEHDDVVEQFSARRADPPLGESVLLHAMHAPRRGPAAPCTDDGPTGSVAVSACSRTRTEWQRIDP